MHEKDYLYLEMVLLHQPQYPRMRKLPNTDDNLCLEQAKDLQKRGIAQAQDLISQVCSAGFELRRSDILPRGRHEGQRTVVVHKAVLEKLFRSATQLPEEEKTIVAKIFKRVFYVIFSITNSDSYNLPEKAPKALTTYFPSFAVETLQKRFLFLI